ncbi:MAG: SIMPL domain-containing protein, partial [Patescibacteria group bacterium]
DMNVANLSMYDNPYYPSDGKGGSSSESSTGFIATKSIRATLASEDDIADATDAIITAGAVRIDSISLEYKEINFVVEGRAKTAKEAMNLSNTTLAKVKTALADYGVSAKKGFTINSFYLDKSYDSTSSDSSTQEKEFTATHTFSLRVKGLDRVDSLVDLALGAGADRINNIGYAVDGMKAVKKQARMAALADAREKAQELADAAGLKLGKIKAISANVLPSNSVPYYDMYGAMPGTDVPPGLTRVEVELDVVFEVVAPTAAKK